ncbi:hypothetical protein [Fluviicola sp.]|jgi:hypothetical protein|uniref:hypothetical protein n=1 Tax=Fluviicola sp. TaxID=1917219 RepID=UPI00281891D5|nr:hypothetical protein [Fluviicola sp.]MDR0800940.1 hypothetical protein [Fluviicola sp.]
MKINDIIGKTVTSIYSSVTTEVGGLDTGECFIELDNKFIIDIPFSFSDDVWQKTLKQNAVNLFADLSDYPVYHINKEEKTIAELAEKYQRKRRNVFSRLRKIIFGQDVVLKEYKPYKVEYRENELKYLKDRKIVDFIWYDDYTEKGFILLDNEYLITETTIAPHGTGLAGLNYYKSMNDLTKEKGNEYFRLSDKMGCC